jgi:translation elongation factor EF-G
MNILDTPGKYIHLFQRPCRLIINCQGHTNFSDEVCAAVRLADGAVLFVDAVEGVKCLFIVAPFN